MKKALALCLALFIGFIAAWIIKPKTPAVRPDSYSNGLTGSGNWWITTVSADEVDAVWKIDKEIDANYIPVPGADELYMVIDESGRIIKYRHRVKQADGSWLWEDVNPDIPENYEAVEGLENVYKVTDKDGNVTYYKYVRNNDNDTFAFVLCDEHGNNIETKIPEGADIPDNFKRMGGNVYAVLNDKGVVIDYMERFHDDNGYYWRSVEKPPVTEDDYNEWLHGQAVDIGSLTGGGSGSGGTSVVLVPQPTIPPEVYATPQPGNPGGNTDPQNPGGQQGGTTEQGYFTETENIITKETNGGYVITYQTVITKVYNTAGEIVSTNKQGPVEISREPISGSSGKKLNKSDIASSLNAEVTRISKGVTFKNDLANEVLAELNAKRAELGYSPLIMNTDSSVYKIARCRAAACSIAGSSDHINPLYGSLGEMLGLFGVSSTGPSECTWRTQPKSASAICARFLGEDGSKDAILSSYYSTVGIAIAESNGYIFIEIVFI